MSAEQDRADVKRVLEGDVDAFEGIVRRWQGPLLNLAYRYCRDRGQAEELVQEAFLRAFRKLSLFRAESTFSTWLFTLASRVCISHMRRYVPPHVRVEDAGPRSALTSEAADPLEHRDREETVRRAVTALPPKYRDTLVLFYFHDQDVEQAAATLGIAVGTLKSRLHRGRKILKQRLAGLPAGRALAEEV